MLDGVFWGFGRRAGLRLKVGCFGGLGLLCPVAVAGVVTICCRWWDCWVWCGCLCVVIWTWFFVWVVFAVVSVVEVEVIAVSVGLGNWDSVPVECLAVLGECMSID